MGGYAGFGEPDPDGRNVGLYETILSGDVEGNDAPVADPLDLVTEPTRAENSWRVVGSGGVGVGTVFDGFTVTAGNANDPQHPNTGGGMSNYYSTLTVINCRFTNNSALSFGGAIFGWDSTCTLDNCTFTRNAAVASENYGGGAINYVGGGDWKLTNCYFSGNAAGYGGGALWVSGTNPELTDCTFVGNSAGERGGAIQIGDSSPMLTNCTFIGNSVYHENSYGGAILNFRSNATYVNCTFRNNSAQKGAGGAISAYTSNPTLLACTFSENQADGEGGAISNYSSSPILTDRTFSGNHVAYGGGMANRNYVGTGCSPRLTNCSFTGNSGWGAGMASQSGSSPELTDCTFESNVRAGIATWNDQHLMLTNCVFRSNSGGGVRNGLCPATIANCLFIGNSSPGSGGGLATGGAQCTVTNCTFKGNSAGQRGGGPSSSDATLANCVIWGNTPDEVDAASSTVITYSDIQGGWAGVGNIDLDPMFADADGRLVAGSPCIDAGDNAPVPPDVTTDLDGSPRIAGGVVDMGAYEY